MSEAHSASGSEPTSQIVPLRKDAEGVLTCTVSPEFVDYHDINHRGTLEFRLGVKPVDASRVMKLKGSVCKNPPVAAKRKSNTRQVAVNDSGSATLRLPKALFRERGLFERLADSTVDKEDLDELDLESVSVFIESDAPGDFTIFVGHPTMDLEEHTGPDFGSPEEIIKCVSPVFYITDSGRDTEYQTARFVFPVAFTEALGLDEETVVTTHIVLVDGNLGVRFDFSSDTEESASGGVTSQLWAKSVRTVNEETSRVTETVRFRMNFPLFLAAALGWVSYDEEGKMKSDSAAAVAERDGSVLVTKDP